MSRHTVITCNRCKEEIERNMSVIEIKCTAGFLNAALRESCDLCRDCAGELLDWLGSKPERKVA